MKRYLTLLVLVAVLVAASLTMAAYWGSSPAPHAYWGSLAPTGAYDGAD